MHFLGLLLLSLAKVFRLLINLYTFIVAAAVIISWVKPDPYNPIVRFLHQATEPVFNRVRRILPRPLARLNIDLSAIIVFMALIVIETLFVGLLFDWSTQLLSK